MKGFAVPALLFLAVTLVNIIVPSQSSSRPFPIPLLGLAVEVGIYDPHRTFDKAGGVRIEHVFVDWNRSSRVTRDGLRAAARKKRDLILTLEPFPESRSARARERLADDILAGAYDSRLQSHCGALAEAPVRVFFRFGHEMDFNNGRYAWSGLESQKFIAVYRHAVGVCRRSAPMIVAMWSPGGDPDLMKYYPGKDVVDAVGLSLFGLQPWDDIAYGRPRSFAEAFGEKYRLVSGLQKPVFISEFGVCGDSRYKAQWLSGAFRRGQEDFPLLKGVVYFNDREPYRWKSVSGPRRTKPSCDMELPDWRL